MKEHINPRLHWLHKAATGGSIITDSQFADAMVYIINELEHKTSLHLGGSCLTLERKHSLFSSYVTAKKVIY